MARTKLRDYLVVITLSLWVIPCQAAQPLVFTTFEQSGSQLVTEPLLKEAYRRIGQDIKIVSYPGNRAIEMANSGKVDGELARLPVIEKFYPNLVRIPTPLQQVKQMVFTKDIRFKVDGWSSLQPYTVATLRGYKDTENNLKNAGIRYVLVPHFSVVINSIHLGKVDIGVLSQTAGMQAIKSAQLTNIYYLEPALSIQPMYHYLHHKHSALIPHINEAIRQLHAEGFVAQLKKDAMTTLNQAE